MTKEYFYNMGVKDGSKLIGSSNSYGEALITKLDNILENYGKEYAEAYKDGILAIVIELKQKKK